MGPTNLAQGTRETIWMAHQGRRPIKWGQKTNGCSVQKPLKSRLRSPNSHCSYPWKHCSFMSWGINLAQMDASMSILLPTPARVSYLYQLWFDNSSQSFEMSDRNLKDTLSSIQRSLLFKEDLDSRCFQKHIKNCPPSYLSPFLPSVHSPQKHLRTIVLFNGKCSTGVHQ